MFKVLILAARHTVSDERMEFLIRDRLSWLRFLGFDLGAPTPDRNTIWTFRERLVRKVAAEQAAQDIISGKITVHDYTSDSTCPDK